MSDIEDHSDEGDNAPTTFAEDDGGYQLPLSAVPPKVAPQEEGQMEISSSPAFQCLDDLFQEGKLTGTRVAQFKDKYSFLHATLKASREQERHLLQVAKEYTAKLERQKVELERADNFPESSANTEVGKLRQQLLKHNNELRQYEERQYQQAYRIETMTDEKKLLEREYQRLPKAGEIEKKTKDLQGAAEEMRREIAQKQLEAKAFREQAETHGHTIAQQKKLFQEKQELEDELKGELVMVNSKPNQIAKEADKIQRQKNEILKKVAGMDEEYTALRDATLQLENKRRQLEEEKFQIEAEVGRQRAVKEGRERELNQLMKEYEEAKEREAQLLEDRGVLDLSLRQMQMEKKTTHDTHSRRQREKDRELRSLKKAELQLRMAEDSVNHFKQVHDKTKGTLDATPKDDGTLRRRREEISKEVENTKRGLTQQRSLEAVETVKVEQSLAEEERLLFEQSDLRIEVVELTRLAAIKADEREQKARDFMRAEMRYHRAVEDLKTKKLQIQDQQKKYQEMNVRLSDFAKLYDVIKNERNKCVNLIQTSTQKAAEMREKIKILQNETEILRTTVMQRERMLQKHRLKHMNALVVRDALRNEVAKQQRIEAEMREKREQQRMDITKLTQMINQIEENMMQLRKQYETAVQRRNDWGVQLIERNEEVCIFYEKVNIQATMIHNGDVELKGREEELRFLNIQRNEEERTRNMMRSRLPEKSNLERELATLQVQLNQCSDRMLELEKHLEDPGDMNRVRFLEGKDLLPAEMQQKIENLESRLAEKEEHMLEKELIYEQVARLTERVRNKTTSGKDDTLSLAKQVNEFQAKIKDVTRKMMATVSELSMNQAQALKFQQQVKNMESDLEQSYMRMERGEPPSSEIELEWQKLVAQEERRHQEHAARRAEEENSEQHKLSGGVVTTAEPRPNAYIPDDDRELPIPRPYGAHAPFKPSEPGSSMRHIRKPVPKPIEI